VNSRGIGPARTLGALVAVVVLSATSAHAAPPIFRAPFRPFEVLNPPAFNMPLALVDLNHDGRPDVVLDTQGFVAVMLGGDDFALSEPTHFGSFGPPAMGITIADVDGDGNPDAVVARDGWGYYPGRGDGTFGPFRPMFEDGPVGSVVVTDLNGDGIPDLVGAGSDAYGALIVRLGLGGGVMDSSYRYSFPSGWRNTGLAIADVNGDGVPDALVSWGYGSGGCVVLLGTGGGRFGAAVSVGAGGQNLFAGDFNHDGHIDFVTGRSVYLGRGDGTFVAGQSLNADVAAVADLDRDGNLDLILLHDASVEVLSGRGDGTFATRGTYPCGRTPGHVAVGDMNGDGYLDLVISLAGSSPALSLLIGDGAGGFGSLNAVPTGLAPRTVLVGDVTGDGVPDLITTDRGERHVGVRPGLGGFAFGSRVVYDAAAGVGAATLADLNGDGRSDLATANDTSSTVSTFLTNPGGGFGARRDFPTTGQPVAVAAGDFDEDGHLDVVAATKSVTDPSGLFKGDGVGGLSLVCCSDYYTYSDDVVVADWNRDGHLDVLLMLNGSSEGEVRALEGDGAWSFRPDYVAPAGPRLSEMAVADVNGDGYPDAVMTRDSAAVFSTLTAVAGGGGGLFYGRATVGAVPTDMVLADFDGDGLIDVAVACYGVNAVSVLRGHGDGTFGDRVDYGVGDGPVSLAVADLNRDGAPELLVACERSNEVVILEDLTARATPVLVSLVDSHATSREVELDWAAPGRPNLQATVYRRQSLGPWESRASVRADAAGRIHFTDLQVEAGRDYGYRLGWIDQASEQFNAEVRVGVPGASLALAGSRPNPSDASLTVAFSLPDASPARLELLDVTGRLIRRLEVGTLGAGDHVIAMGSGLDIRPGIYVVRLARGGDTRSARVAVIQ